MYFSLTMRHALGNKLKAREIACLDDVSVPTLISRVGLFIYESLIDNNT